MSRNKDDSLRVRHRISAVEMEVIEERDEDAGTSWWGYAYVDSSGVPPAQLHVDGGIHDWEQWRDDTGYEWPPEVWEKFLAQLPKQSPKPRREILVEGALGPQVDGGVAALLEQNRPP